MQGDRESLVACGRPVVGPISRRIPAPPMFPTYRSRAIGRSRRAEKWSGCPDCPVTTWRLRRSRGHGPFHVPVFVAQLVLACPDHSPIDSR